VSAAATQHVASFLLPMQRLRQLTQITRLVLAWFVLTLGVAVASPIVNPQAMELVCTSGAQVKLVTLDDDGTQASPSHSTLDCPACLAITLPASTPRFIVERALPQRPTWPPISPSRLGAPSGAALPPRGPPTLA
jgi:hypothetical protein